MKTLLMSVLILLISSGLFSDWNEVQKIFASDGNDHEWFGQSVSISGGNILIGAYSDFNPNINDGSAYIFHKEEDIWTEETKLIASNYSDTLKYFGTSVSLDENYALIGALGNGNASGTAYVFHRNGTDWIEEEMLFADDGEPQDYFGYSVSIDGNFAVIGAFRDDDMGFDSGAAYIFNRMANNWIQETKLVPFDGAEEDFFGNVVYIWEDYIVVGSPHDDDNGENSGSAYVYHKEEDSWILQSKITASDGEPQNGFGRAVSIYNDHLAVGSWCNNSGSSGGDLAGSVYIFKRYGDVWLEEEKLTAFDANDNDWFGRAVSINEDYVVIGAEGDDDIGSCSGSVYCYQKVDDTWNFLTKLTASDGAEYDRFGGSVSIFEDNIVVGAYADDVYEYGSGSCYIFQNDGLGLEEYNVQPSNNLFVSNYPNPFNPSTTIEFSIIYSSTIELAIFNLKGQKIKTLAYNEFEKGVHSVIWNGDDEFNKPVGSGVYLYNLKVNGKTEAMKKCLLLK